MITIKVELEDLTLIDDAVEQALRLANQLQVIVQFKFNGIKMRVKPKSDENEIIETYLDKHRSKADGKEFNII